MTRSPLANISVSDGRATKKKRDKAVVDLWVHWCQETGRPDAGAVPDPVAEAIRLLIGDGFEPDDIRYLISSAARLRPGRTDRLDIKRLVDVMSDSRITFQAQQAYEQKKPVYPYTPYQPNLRLMRDELADLLGDDEDAWDGAEEADALWLMEKMDREAIQQQRDDMERAGVWSSPMSPSEFRQRKRQRKWREAIDSTAAKRKPEYGGKTTTYSYHAGAAEVSSVEDIDFSVDPIADRMFERGASARRVIDLHNQAPEGYWSDVARLMDDGVPIRRAYSLLSSQYDGWHPKDRRK